LRLENTDSMTRRSLEHLARWPLTAAVASGGDELDRDELDRALVLGAPEALVGEQNTVGMSLGEPKQRSRSPSAGAS
jgi:hypothetical protein